MVPTVPADLDSLESTGNVLNSAFLGSPELGKKSTPSRRTDPSSLVSA